MPCLIKERTATSPGIITFTDGEAVYGALYRNTRVRRFMEDATREGRWLFGVHIQGDESWMERWPLRDWQSFILWPDRDAPWLHNVPDTMRIGLNCVNLMPVPPSQPAGMTRNVDICVISRASHIKRIRETLLTLRALMDLRPSLTATIIVPDNRHLVLGDKAYAKQGINRDFFELPLRLFKAHELKQISFVVSSNDAFGRFPLADGLMTDILYRSRFMYLPSHREGTPRVIAESFMTNTPVILSQKIKTGMRKDLGPQDTLFVDDDPDAAARQMNAALDQYDRFQVDTKKFRDLYSRETNQPVFQSALSDLIRARNLPADGRWFMDDLHLRLACHGQLGNFVFQYSEKLFFEWMVKIDVPGGMVANPYDEQSFYGDISRDRPSPGQRVSDYLRGHAPRSLIKLAKRMIG